MSFAELEPHRARTSRRVAPAARTRDLDRRGTGGAPGSRLRRRAHGWFVGVGAAAGNVVFRDLLPEPERHRSGSASKPCVTVSKSHGSSTSWRLSRAPLVAISFLGRL